MESNAKSRGSRTQRDSVARKADSVLQLHEFCQRHHCDLPKYIFENKRLTLFLSGTHVFSKIPEFQSKNKVRSHVEGEIDVAKQAIRWIQNSPSPSLYWKNSKTEELITDFMAELGDGVYENGTDKKDLVSFMQYLEDKAKDKLRDRLERKGVPKKSCGTPPQYTSAFEVCRLSHVTCTAANAYPEIICAPNVVFKTDNFHDRTNFGNTIAYTTISPSPKQERLPPLTDLEKFYGSVGVMGNIALVKDLDDKLRLLIAIMSQDGYKFLARLQVLSIRHGKKRLEFLQYLMDFFCEDLIKDITGDFLRGERSWTEKNMAQFSQVQSKNLFGVFNSVASSLGYKSEENLKLFLSWHQNDEISQRLRKIEEQKPGKTSQIPSDALRYHQLNIFREINTFIGDSSDGQRIKNHFIFLADCSVKGALGFLAAIDHAAGSFGIVRFLEFSLQLYHCGVYRWALNNKHVIGNDAMFFQKVFLLVRALNDRTASQAVKDVVATIEQLVPAGILANNATTPISQGAQAPTPDSSPAPITPSFDEQRQLPPTTTNPSPKPKSKFNLPGSKLSPPSSKASSYPSKNVKKADTTLPEATKSTKRPILARGKCIKCPRAGYKIHHDGKILCLECRTRPL
ncbi:uncharacterized protein EAF01_002285 [Botrytis porri]|uniref:uncharacterized protein n=1 Tax=Botrytis porri TaxID=87229 RepID=UPI0018FF69A1|nr:uncharacterized protein EAF01_002285 [Botrytis porri]KAF7910776.1 hypothetical protein EAF01_002285 [Botrytis porri]